MSQDIPLQDNQVLRLLSNSGVTPCQDSACDQWRYWDSRRALERRHQYCIWYTLAQSISILHWSGRAWGNVRTYMWTTCTASLDLLGRWYMSYGHVKSLHGHEECQNSLIHVRNVPYKNVFGWVWNIFKIEIAERKTKRTSWIQCLRLVNQAKKRQNKQKVCCIQKVKQQEATRMNAKWATMDPV